MYDAAQQSYTICRAEAVQSSMVLQAMLSSQSSTLLWNAVCDAASDGLHAQIAEGGVQCSSRNIKRRRRDAQTFLCHQSTPQYLKMMHLLANPRFAPSRASGRIIIIIISAKRAPFIIDNPAGNKATGMPDRTALA